MLPAPTSPYQFKTLHSALMQNVALDPLSFSFDQYNPFFSDFGDLIPEKETKIFDINWKVGHSLRISND